MSNVVEESVQCLGASVEVSTVDGVGLVGDKPVGRPEHREKEQDGGFTAEGCPEADKLGLPTRVLHQNDSRPIRPDNLLCIRDEEPNNGAQECQNDKNDVRAVWHVDIGLRINAVGKHNLPQTLRLVSSMEVPRCASEGERIFKDDVLDSQRMIQR